MKIESLQFVGAITLVPAKAAFDRANLIAASLHEPRAYMEVTAYAEPDAVLGRPLAEEQVGAIVRAKQAVRFDPVPAAMGAALWVFRRSFVDRDKPIGELRASGFLVRDYISLPDEAFGFIVREHADTFALRDRWAESADHDADEGARHSQWHSAREAASRAFVLERSMSPRRVAMLALAHQRLGNTVRADGYIEMARRSRGDDFAREVLEQKNGIETQLEQVVSLLARSREVLRPHNANAIHRASRQANHDGMILIRQGKRR